jgi:hypothetical protein
MATLKNQLEVRLFGDKIAHKKTNIMLYSNKILSTLLFNKKVSSLKGLNRITIYFNKLSLLWKLKSRG